MHNENELTCLLGLYLILLKQKEHSASQMQCHPEQSIDTSKAVFIAVFIRTEKCSKKAN